MMVGMARDQTALDTGADSKIKLEERVVEPITTPDFQIFIAYYNIYGVKKPVFVYHKLLYALHNYNALFILYAMHILKPFGGGV